MEAILFEIGPFLLYPAVLFFALYASTRTTSTELKDKITDDFQLASEEMGLSFELASNQKELLLTGLREGIPVEARIALTGGKAGTLIAKPAGLNTDLRILDTIERNKLGLQEGLEDYKVGEPHFDSLLVVQGPPPDIYAALTEGARSALIEVIAHDGFRVEDGQLEIELTARESTWMRKNFKVLLQTAREFVMPESRAARYLKNYLAEGSGVIALRNAKFLLQEEPDSPEARELTELLLADAKRSFVHGATDGTSPEGNTDLGTDPTPSSQREPLGLYASEATNPFLASEATDSPDEDTKRCDIFAHFPEWLEVLALLIEREPERALLVTQFFVLDERFPVITFMNPPSQEQLAVAIGKSASPRGRQILWSIIRAGHGDLPSAITGLGRLGVIEDVEPLLALPFGLFDVDLKFAINQAVALIQERVEGGGAGTLALVDEKKGDGGLSLDLSEGGLSTAAPDE